MTAEPWRRFDEVQLRRYRGETLNHQFAVRFDDGPDCGALVLGGPTSLVGWTLDVRGRVEGTGTRLYGDALKEREGTATEPAEIAIRMLESELEKAFEEGAHGTFLLQVRLIREGQKRTVFLATVDVLESAYEGEDILP